MKPMICISITIILLFEIELIGLLSETQYIYKTFTFTKKNSRVEYPRNLKRVKNAVRDENYAGQYTFHRVLFDKSKTRAYLQVDLPKEQARFGIVGLRLKKENGT